MNWKPFCVCLCVYTYTTLYNSGPDGTKFAALTNARARIINKANAELTGTLPSGMKSGVMSSNRPLPLSR